MLHEITWIDYHDIIYQNLFTSDRVLNKRSLSNKQPGGGGAGVGRGELNREITLPKPLQMFPPV